MTNAGEIHEELYDVQHAEGCVVVGWKTDATSDGLAAFLSSMRSPPKIS